MEGKSQKRQEQTLEASKGELGRNPSGSLKCAIHPTSGKDTDSHSGIELMEEVVSRPNMTKAYKRVVANKGAPGVDGMKIEDFRKHLTKEWAQIKEELLEGRYQPRPVRRVEIPKPNGGTRNLGIPTVMDRLIQQALNQVLSKFFEPKFSDHSYGFRPGRRAAQAILAAKSYVKDGRRWVVDMDLEKFFDKVNHDILMERIRRQVQDSRVLTLIRRYLRAGVMEDGTVRSNEEGTPQGGPLSPLLSNIMLTDLDRELERRGHAFCRYADDCNIYVRSEKAGQRVLESITRFLERKLRLKVNREKSAVDRPWKRKFLGFSFTSQHLTKIRVHAKSIKSIKDKVKALCRVGRGMNQRTFIETKLNPALRGWATYFKEADTYTFAKQLDTWIRRRLRKLLWKQWDRIKTRYRKLAERGLDPKVCYMMANSSRGAWRMTGFSKMAEAFPYTYFDEQGLVSLYTIIRSR